MSDVWVCRTREKKKQKAKELAAIDHKNIDYISFRKNFYSETPDIAAMTDLEVEEYRKELEDIKIRVRPRVYVVISLPPVNFPCFCFVFSGTRISCIGVYFHRERTARSPSRSGTMSDSATKSSRF